MTTALIVDWLGRGGIAQTTQAWAAELDAHAVDVSVVTRLGREIEPFGRVAVAGAGGTGGRLRSHLAVADAAVAAIEDVRPDVVVIQNFVVPPVERRVHETARRFGARVVFVIHDHRLHSRLAGLHLGLERLLARADVLVAHSRFVADGVGRHTGRDVVQLPLPALLGVLAHPRPSGSMLPERDEAVALHFGIVKRRYKGTDTVQRLASGGMPGWRFAIVGSGAPEPTPSVATIPRFVDAGELCAVVEESAVTLFPYRMATQSGGVLLAQLCGSVPVATAVGALHEQIEDGRTGRLVPPDAPLEAWREVLDDLRDDHVREAMVGAGRAAAWDGHAAFVRGALETVA